MMTFYKADSTAFVGATNGCQPEIPMNCKGRIKFAPTE